LAISRISILTSDADRDDSHLTFMTSRDHTTLFGWDAHEQGIHPVIEAAAADFSGGTSTNELISGESECHPEHGYCMSRQVAHDSARFDIEDPRRSTGR